MDCAVYPYAGSIVQAVQSSKERSQILAVVSVFGIYIIMPSVIKDLYGKSVFSGLYTKNLFPLCRGSDTVRPWDKSQ